ncbi:MAG: aspartate--tRNA ligase [Firmicutes bacterium]|nr:aspartate--tRNA ligase [Bacillota bacterium]
MYVCRCGEVCENLIDKHVQLYGWVASIRDHGGVKFIDLRDETGILQVVTRENKDITKESVVKISGKLLRREPALVNKKVKTGEFEVVADEIIVVNKCASIPFEIQDSFNVKEELRLKYRFLDLRNERNHSVINLRSEILNFLRNKMYELGFKEIHTPILSGSSPEGARDYLVPSRKHIGKFYALPQAPQIFKQLLMVSGFEKYYQIAPCFRDEDSRAERTPGEFYQLDFEMAFASQEDILKIGEIVLSQLFKKFGSGRNVTFPFHRISYQESMEKYGTDKPDLRNKLIISDVSEIFLNSNFQAFEGKTVKTILVPKAGNPRKFFDKMNKFAQDIGMQGIGYIKIGEDMKISGPIGKFIPEVNQDLFLKTVDAIPNSTVFFIADCKINAQKYAGKIRNKLAQELNLIDEESFEFCYITDFNMYEMDDENNIVFKHNPFSMPQGGIEALEDNPLDVIAYQYDIVCNGVEISSGAVRNHDSKCMLKAFEIAGYSKEDVMSKFHSLYSALCFGAPPHAGMAPGIERIVMLLSNSKNIREVTAFPMNSNAQDLLFGAPSRISEKQLREIHFFKENGLN